MIVVQEFGKLSHSSTVHAFRHLQVSIVLVVEILLQSSGPFPLPFADFALVAPESCELNSSEAFFLAAGGDGSRSVSAPP